MTKELLKESPIYEDIEIENLTEAEDDGLKLLKIKGTASRGDMFNRNHRMYPTKVLRKVTESVQPLIKKGKLTGQLDHPSFFGGNGELERTAIKFTNMWMEGNDLKFEGNVIPTTLGKELEALLRAKVGVGMSTRGYGTVKPHTYKNGKEHKMKSVVQDDFELYGVDAVLNESNQYGKIAQFEQKEGGKNVEDLTLKQLKEDYADLVEEVKAEMEADIEKDFDKKVNDAVDVKLAEAKEQYKTEVMESDDVKKLQDFINSLVESVTPFVPGQQEYEESEKQKTIDDLNAKLDEAKEKLDTAIAEAEAFKVEKAEIAAQAEITKHLDAKLESHRYATQLRQRLSECKSVDEIDSKFAQEVAFIDSLFKTKDEPTGDGKPSINEDDDSVKQAKLSAEKEKARKLAGIKNSEKGGK